jgi:hypothetical protein
MTVESGRAYLRDASEAIMAISHGRRGRNDRGGFELMLMLRLGSILGNLNRV